MASTTWIDGASLAKLEPGEVEARFARRPVHVVREVFAGCQGRLDGAVRGHDGVLRIDIRVHRVIDNPTCAIMGIGRGSSVLVDAGSVIVGAGDAERWSPPPPQHFP